MATPKKKTTKAASATKVTRIKANDSSTAKKPAKSAAKKSTVKTAEPIVGGSKRRNPLKAFGGYFVGAWHELRQVRWPNRRATWTMTAALLIFVAFFVTLILLLDTLFQSLFQSLVS